MIGFLILMAAGLLVGLAIAITVHFFGVKSDKLVDDILELLPGANCGGCGYAGCAGYAKAMARGSAKPGACPSQPAENRDKICALLGVEAVAKETKMAVVCCSGGDDKATRNAFYNGVNNCRDAVQVASGSKSCAFGCLGLGACARVCPFGAIEINECNLAVVHPELCIGCGKCVNTCPKKLIRLVPRSAKIMVRCSNPNKGAVKMKVCKAACIGCSKCVKADPEHMQMNGTLACINFGNPPDQELAKVCPTKALR